MSVDGETFGKDQISFEVEGETFTFAEMATVQAYYWNYGHLATIIVKKPGGLDESRPHEFDYFHAIRTYYLPFYMSDRTKLTMGKVIE
ncbi:MAG TPA: hypothetical protein DCM45_06505 [Clostridiales bacterium]|nr:hypothetical protein [Clostridiales bacterium]